MKKGAFFTGLSWLFLLNLAIKPLWVFGIDRAVQNTVGAQVYGAYFSLFGLSYVLLFIADAGLTNLLTQRLAARPDYALRPLLKRKLLMLLLYAVAVGGVALATGVSVTGLLIYLVLMQMLGSLLLFLRGMLTAHQQFKTDAFFSVADKAAMLLACSGFVYGLIRPITITLFLQLQVLCTGAAVLVLAGFIFRKGWLKKGSVESSSGLLRQLIPFAAIVLLMSAHYRLDGFLLGRFHPQGATEAGIYAGAYRLLDAGNMMGYLAASFLVPFIARNGNTVAVQNTVLLTRHVLLLVAVVVAAFVLAYAPQLQRLLYHTQNAYAAAVMKACLLSLPAYYLVQVYGSVLTAYAQLRGFIAILCVCVFINALLNMLLIPSMGAMGCCIAAVVSQYACGIACWVIASKKQRWNFGARWMGWYVAMGSVAYSVFALSKNSVAVWVILAVVAVLLIAMVIYKQAWLKQRLATLNYTK